MPISQSLGERGPSEESFIKTETEMIMPLSNLVSNLRPGLLVTSLKALIRSILFIMGLDHVLIEFFSRAAAGAASVLMVIFVVGLGMPRRAESPIRHNRRR